MRARILGSFMVVLPAASVRRAPRNVVIVEPLAIPFFLFLVMRVGCQIVSRIRTKCNGK